MALKRKTWLRDHINKISDAFENHRKKKNYVYRSKQISNEQKLYSIVQPTGLMYGHPVKPVIDYGYKTKNWDDKEKMKLIVADALMHQELINKANQNRDEIREYLIKVVDRITEFYQKELSHKKVRTRTWWGRKRTNLEILDRIINNRLIIKSRWKNHFWASFFNNSMLFLDIYLFGKWISSKKGNWKSTDFAEKQKQIRITLLKLIAASAYANKTIEEEERKLFDFFLDSALLSSEDKKEAQQFIDSDMLLEEIDFSIVDDWILKKYFLEMGILTIWADRVLEESEKIFVKDLAFKLDLNDEEFENSMLAIESFVLTNWHDVHFLRKNRDFNIVKEQWRKRMSDAVRKNKNAVAQEIKESKELMMLLKKQRKEDLTDEEKQKVHEQLIDVLKTLPVFVIIAIPGTFMTLPILISILPKSVFPSAFSDEEDE